MKHILILLCNTLGLLGFSQTKFDVMLVDSEGVGIPEVQIYVDEFPETTFYTDVSGKATLPQGDYNYIISHPYYESKTLDGNELNANPKIVLQKKRKFVVLKEMDVKYKKTKIDFQKLMDAVIPNHNRLLEKEKFTFVLDGRHKVQGISHDGSKDYLNFDNTMYLSKPKRRKYEIGFDSNICLSNVKRNTSAVYPYTISFRSPIFLSSQLNYLDVKLLPFVKSIKQYAFNILEAEDGFLVKFKPKKNDSKWKWHGYLIIDSAHYVRKLFMSMEFNKDNYSVVRSAAKNKKDPSSKMYFKELDVEIEFAQNDNNIVPTKFFARSELMHFIANREQPFQIQINSNFHISQMDNKRCDSPFTINQFFYASFYNQ